MEYACVALVDRRGWILMQERDERPLLDPERWGFPGGAVEAGEDYLQAAYRELVEETGVRLDHDPELFGRFGLAHPVAERAEFALFVTGVDLADGDVACHEGRQMVFVDPQRARHLDLTESAATALPLLLDSDLYERLAR